MSTSSQLIQKLIERYRTTAKICYDDDTPTRQANSAMLRNHKCYLQLRESVEGRQAIMALMDDAEPEVRLVAATHSLFWDEARARHAIEQLCGDQIGLLALHAVMTLHMYNQGRIDFEWYQPRKK
jgi:hypothetical protein